MKGNTQSESGQGEIRVSSHAGGAGVKVGVGWGEGCFLQFVSVE